MMGKKELERKRLEEKKKKENQEKKKELKQSAVVCNLKCQKRLTEGVEFSLTQQLYRNSKLLITTIQIDSYFVSFAFTYHKRAITSHCCEPTARSVRLRDQPFQIELSPPFVSDFKTESFRS